MVFSVPSKISFPVQALFHPAPHSSINESFVVLFGVNVYSLPSRVPDSLNLSPNFVSTIAGTMDAVHVKSLFFAAFTTSGFKKSFCIFSAFVQHFFFLSFNNLARKLSMLSSESPVCFDFAA